MSKLTSKKKKSTEPPFECGKCGAKFTLLASLYMHDLRHKGERRYECYICDKRFYSTGDLNRHKKTHFGVQEFHCNECDKRFSRKVSLKNHIYRVHFHIKDFSIRKMVKKIPKPCKDCGKVIHPDSLRVHRRKHTGEKPYLCLRCISTYVDPSSIRQHMRCHVKKGQVFCRNCQAIFNSETELNSHVGLQHESKNHYQLYTIEEVEKIKLERNHKENQKLESGYCEKNSIMQNPSSSVIKLEAFYDGGHSVEVSFSEDAFKEVEIKHEPLDFLDTD